MLRRLSNDMVRSVQKPENTVVIAVNTQNVTVQSPVQVEMIDASGAHVELTLLVGNLPPIRHAFDFTEGTVIIPLKGLAKGKHKCTLIVHAFKHKLSMNRMYDVTVSANGKFVAGAKGNIPVGRSNDVGFGDFLLTVL
jgi:hypothetical protein